MKDGNIMKDCPHCVPLFFKKLRDVGSLPLKRERFGW